jgi:hypothetical protein
MRPNFPSQMGQRLAAPAGVYLDLWRIFASSRLCVGTRWRSPFVHRRSWRKGEEQRPDRSGLPDPAAYRDIVRRASLPCAASAGVAADVWAGTSLVRRDTDVIQTACLVALALDLFSWDRGHPVTCSRLFRSAARLGGWGPLAQSYVGKRFALKGIAAAYGSLLAGSHDLLANDSPDEGGMPMERSGRLTPAWGRGRPAEAVRSAAMRGREKRDRSAFTPN